MKFRIHFSNNTETVPFNYAHHLCSVFHHWLGPNDLHDMMSLYSLGWLKHGKASKGGLDFPNGSSWEIGIQEAEIAERLIQGLLLKPTVLYGMQVRRVDRVESPAFEGSSFRFLAGSPVTLWKVEKDNSRTYICYDRPEQSASIITRILRKEMAMAGLDNEPARIWFDPDFPRPKTKLIDIKGIKNRGSVCPVIVEGSPHVQKLAWTVGAGELIGVGFRKPGGAVEARNGS